MTDEQLMADALAMNLVSAPFTVQKGPTGPSLRAPLIDYETGWQWCEQMRKHNRFPYVETDPLTNTYDLCIY